MLLALDPGERKLGWALVAADGTPVAQGIWPAAQWTDHLLALPVVHLEAKVPGGCMPGVELQGAVGERFGGAPVVAVQMLVPPGHVDVAENEVRRRTIIEL